MALEKARTQINKTPNVVGATIGVSRYGTSGSLNLDKFERNYTLLFSEIKLKKSSSENGGVMLGRQ